MSTRTCSPPNALTLPSPSTLPVLLGRSNYHTWHSAIHPCLTSHPHARTLLSGSWTDSRATYGRSSPSSPSPLVAAFNTNNNSTVRKGAPSGAQNNPQLLVASWEHTNLAICRFIRGTLAMNVLPFVRRHEEAKALWDALVGLYGEGNGIAMAGGPVMGGSGSIGDGGKKGDPWGGSPRRGQGGVEERAGVASGGREGERRLWWPREIGEGDCGARASPCGKGEPGPSLRTS